MLLRGNHKLERSELNTAALEKEIDKEVEQRWALLLTVESTHCIKNEGVVPLGVSEKLSINEKIEHYTKICVTQKCSLLGPSGLSINKRVLRDKIQPCFYGF